MPNNFFRFKRFTIYQDRCAMKVGTDGSLLAAWADIPQATSARILDIGTGTGLIAIMMAQRAPLAEITGIDIDADAASQARENAASSPFANRIRIANIALQNIEDEVYDAIVCNPPYFIDSLKCPDKQRSIARHASELTFERLMSDAFRLLDDAGEISVIVPADAKQQMDSASAIAGLHPKRICFVKTSPSKNPKRVLLSYGKQWHNTVENNTIIIGDERYKTILKDFYLNF